MNKPPLAVTTSELCPELWPAVETLFAATGACGGCWCQAWRIEKGERWADVKGPRAKERLRRGVLSGEVHGVLAFDGEMPVGWCTFGPRDSFPRLNRARSLNDPGHCSAQKKAAAQGIRYVKCAGSRTA